jgi:channel protein (hemolysin III family)
MHRTNVRRRILEGALRSSVGTIPIPGFFEPFSSMLHLAVAAIVLAAGIRLVRAGRSNANRAALAVFAVAAVALFGLSGTYHMLDQGGDGRAIMRRIDHAAIFTMIAGTFTAIHGIAFRGRWRGAFLSTVWLVSLAGLVLKTLFFDVVPEWGGLVLYLGLGWVGAVSAWALWRHHGWQGVRLLLLGGVAYSGGAAYDFLNGPVLVDGVIGPHEIFHLAVALGTFAHWRCIRTLMRVTAAKRWAEGPGPASRLVSSDLAVVW